MDWEGGGEGGWRTQVDVRGDKRRGGVCREGCIGRQAGRQVLTSRGHTLVLNRFHHSLKWLTHHDQHIEKH